MTCGAAQAARIPASNGDMRRRSAGAPPEPGAPGPEA